MKSQLQYYHTKYCSCSYLVNCICEYFTAADSHLENSQHQANLKHENFAVSYHSYTTLLPQNNLQLHIDKVLTLITLQYWIKPTL